MAQDDNGGHELTPARPSEEHRAGDPGTAVVIRDAVENPGFPPHRPRVTDLDPRKVRRAERTVYTLFYLSIAGSVWRSPPTSPSRSSTATRARSD